MFHNRALFVEKMVPRCSRSNFKCSVTLLRSRQCFQGEYAEANRLYLRVIEIGEKTLGPDHLDLATTLNNRAELLRVQVRVIRNFEERGTR